jgi:hypothetical protein
MVRLGAEHDAIRFHEIVDRRAFLEKFRIAHDVERELGVFRDAVGHLRRRPDGHGRFRDDDHLALHRLADLLGDGQHVAKIG